MIINLKDIRLDNIIQYGSKAACLGELSGHGIKVPNGFVLSSVVFKEFLKYNCFPYKYEEYLSYSKEIREFIMQSKIPHELEKEIKTYFDILSNQTQRNYYVVRSSALCEDTGTHSFAGIFESFDNLDSLTLILNSIKKCYASMFNDKALSYMQHNGIELDSLQMGVIIQELIEGCPSGVVFSSDTIQMDDNLLHINAVSGFCSDYVSGKLPSCLYKVNKVTGHILEYQIPQDLFQLSDNYIKIIYEKTLQIEKIFGCPQDIEWTISDGNLIILQARPITTFRDKEFILNWAESMDAEFYWRLGPEIPFPPFVLSLCPLEEAALDYGVMKAGYAHRRTTRCVQNGYIFFRELEMNNWEKVQDEFMSKVHKMFEEGKNIFQDVLLPELLVLRSKLDDFLGRRLTRHA